MFHNNYYENVVLIFNHEENLIKNLSAGLEVVLAKKKTI